MSCLHSIVIVGHGCTQSFILDLSGGSPTTVSLSIASQVVTHSNVILVAVAVRAKILTLSGRRLLTFPNLANITRPYIKRNLPIATDYITDQNFIQCTSSTTSATILS